jgi:hypothetical protein
MRTSGRSIEKLKEDATHKLPDPKKQDWFDGEIEEVIETTSQNDHAMFKSVVSFVDTTGRIWRWTEYLLDSPKQGWKLYRACVARGCGEKFLAGSVDQSDLPGPCRIKIEIQKQRGWPDKLRVADFAPRAAE